MGPRFEELLDWLDLALDDLSSRGLAAAQRAFPEAGKALVDYLEARFVLRVSGIANEARGEWWQLLLTLAARWSDSEKADFVARVALRVVSPGSYRWVAAFVKVSFTSSEVEPWIVAAFASEDRAVRENASLLGYYLFDGDYRLSEGAEAERRRLDPRHPDGVGDQRVG